MFTGDVEREVRRGNEGTEVEATRAFLEELRVEYVQRGEREGVLGFDGGTFLDAICLDLVGEVKEPEEPSPRTLGLDFIDDGDLIAFGAFSSTTKGPDGGMRIDEDGQEIVLFMIFYNLTVDSGVQIHSLSSDSLD